MWIVVKNGMIQKHYFDSDDQNFIIFQLKAF